MLHPIFFDTRLSLSQSAPECVVSFQYVERGNPVLVYSSKFAINPNDDKTILHETTLRFDVKLAVDSYGAYEFVPVSQLTRILETDPDNQLVCSKPILKSKTMSEECISLRRNGFSRRKLPSNKLITTGTRVTTIPCTCIRLQDASFTTSEGISSCDWQVNLSERLR